MDAKAQFELLYAQLVYFHQGFFDGGYKVVGSLLLILGWLVTSDKARSALRRSAFLRPAGVVAILLCSVGYVLLTLGLEARSEKTATLIDALHYAPRSYYEGHIITREAVILVGIIIGAVGALILGTVIKPPADEPIAS